MGGALTRMLGLMPTAAATDPNFSSTKLLLGMNGTAGSTTFTDESAAAHGNATRSGLNNDAQVDAATMKFGSGSLRLDGNNDNIQYADHADWTLSTSDFTIECWALFASGTIDNTHTIAAHYSTTSNQRGWIFEYDGSGATNNLVFLASSDGVTATNLAIGAWTPTADTFYHLVAERSGTTFRVYANGVMIAKGTSALSIFNSSAAFIIGITSNGANPMHGNVDEFRFTLGVARYNSDSGYTVPTAAFPRS